MSVSEPVRFWGPGVLAIALSVPTGCGRIGIEELLVEPAPAGGSLSNSGGTGDSGGEATTTVGGTVGTGGAAGAGAAAGEAGSPSGSGGAVGAGGIMATGGTAGAAGRTANLGGTIDSGGTAGAAGGSANVGGTVGSGGTATGAGGLAGTAGVVGAGGTLATGGTAGAGAAGAGGAGGAGAVGPGGAAGEPGAGGSIPSGGTAGTAGAPPYQCTPGAPEVCDGRDNNCDTQIDEGTSCPQQCSGAEFGGHGYMMCDQRNYTRDEGRIKCEEQGMHLAFLDNQAEYDFAYAWVFGSSSFWIWLGGTDDVTEGEWYRYDGTQFWTGGATGSAVGNAFTAWMTGDPDNDGAGQPGLGNCLVLTVDGWQDEACGSFRRTLCETY